MSNRVTQSGPLKRVLTERKIVVGLVELVTLCQHQGHQEDT